MEPGEMSERNYPSWYRKFDFVNRSTVVPQINSFPNRGAVVPQLSPWAELPRSTPNPVRKFVIQTCIHSASRDLVCSELSSIHEIVGFHFLFLCCHFPPSRLQIYTMPKDSNFKSRTAPFILNQSSPSISTSIPSVSFLHLNILHLPQTRLISRCQIHKAQEVSAFQALLGG